ncbi:hypothetical protein EEB14_57180, partial [Rhodococcus sp. WS4]
MLVPMSPVDSLFLLGECREHPRHVGTLAASTAPDRCRHHLGGFDPRHLPGTAARAARGVAGLVPALAGTVDRTLHSRGGTRSLRAPHTVLNTPIGGARTIAARSWPLERLRLVAKHADAT